MKVIIAIILVVCSIENTSSNEICPSTNKNKLVCYNLEKLPFWASDGQYYTGIKLLQHICKDTEIECSLKIEVYPPDPCLNDPCCGIHNSLCAKTHIDRYECLCKTGYLPSDSGCVIDPCFSDPCCDSNNTACIVCNGQYDCVCLESFIPIDNDALNNGCQEDPCLADPNPCSGIMVATGNIPSIYIESSCVKSSNTSFACVCPVGYVPHDGSNAANGCTPECTTDIPCDGGFTCVGNKCDCSGSIEDDGSCSATDPVAACAAAGGNYCTVTETCLIRRPSVTGCGDLALFRESTTLPGPVDGGGGAPIYSENEELLKCYFGDPILPDKEVYFSTGAVGLGFCKVVQTSVGGASEVADTISTRSEECSNIVSEETLMALCTFP